MQGSPPQLLDGAEADAIGFSECAVDRSGFGNAHLGATDERRDVGGIGVAESHESLRSLRRIDRRFENPTAGDGIARVTHLLNADPSTPIA